MSDALSVAARCATAHRLTAQRFTAQRFTAQCCESPASGRFVDKLPGLLAEQHPQGRAVPRACQLIGEGGLQKAIDRGARRLRQRGKQRRIREERLHQRRVRDERRNRGSALAAGERVEVRGLKARRCGSGARGCSTDRRGHGLTIGWLAGEIRVTATLRTKARRLPASCRGGLVTAAGSRDVDRMETVTQSRAPSTSLRGPALRHYQQETLRALIAQMRGRGSETLTVMFPRQTGKNEVSAVLIAALLREHAATGGSLVVCAPTFHPQAGISFERSRYILGASDMLLATGGRSSAAVPTIAVGKARAVFLSASPEAHVAGHTASIGLIADEAQDIDADWFNRQFRPMAASTGAPTVMFGTPWNGETLLERAVA